MPKDHKTTRPVWGGTSVRTTVRRLSVLIGVPVMAGAVTLSTAGPAFASAAPERAVVVLRGGVVTAPGVTVIAHLDRMHLELVEASPYALHVLSQMPGVSGITRDTRVQFTGHDDSTGTATGAGGSAAGDGTDGAALDGAALDGAALDGAALDAPSLDAAAAQAAADADAAQQRATAAATRAAEAQTTLTATVATAESARLRSDRADRLAQAAHVAADRADEAAANPTRRNRDALRAAARIADAAARAADRQAAEAGRAEAGALAAVDRARVAADVAAADSAAAATDAVAAARRAAAAAAAAAAGQTRSGLYAADGLGGNAGNERAGAGVDIAVIDTGVSDTPALNRASGRLIDAVDTSGLIDGDVINESGVFDDGYGHGTFLADLVAGGRPGPGARRLGVAPGARVHVVRVANAQGEATLFSVLVGLNWVATHADTIEVANLALAAERPMDAYGPDPLNVVSEWLRAAGVNVIVASGNTAGEVSDPGFTPGVLTVGAADLTTAHVTVAPFSGAAVVAGVQKPDIVASGVNLLSMLPEGSIIAQANPGARQPNGLFRGSGTSQATAVASGVAALFLQAHPGASTTDVKNSLRASATPVPDTAAAGAGLAAVSRDISDSAGDGEDGFNADLWLAGAFSGSGFTMADWLPDLADAWFGDASAADDWSASRWGASRWGAHRWGAHRWGADDWDAHRWGASRWGASRWGASRWGASRWGASRWGASRWGANRWGSVGWATAADSRAITPASGMLTTTAATNLGTEAAR